MTAALDWFLHRMAYPFVAISAAALHIYTAFIAFKLAPSAAGGVMAAIAAWITPGVSELVVAIFSWRATGSKVNAYSVWLLAWIALSSATLLSAAVAKRIRIRQATGIDPVAMEATTDSR